MTTPRRTFLAASCAAASSALLAPHVSAMVTGKRIRVGQIGTAHAHASGKLAAMRQQEDLFEVVGVVEPDEARRAAMQKSKAYQGVTFLTEQQLLETPGLAAVAVETAVADLVPTAMRCLAAGKHIHLDKPAGVSLPQCVAMHQLADQNGLTIQMGYMLRYNPAFITLFEMVRDGWLGDITELTGAMSKLASEGLRKDLAQYAGGGMFELSCHLIDAMVTVLGRPDKVTAHNRGTRDDGFLDNQMAVFDYPTAIATIRANHLDPFGFPHRHFNVVGQSGAYHINPLEPPQAKLALDRPRGKYAKGTHALKFERPTGRYDAEFQDLAKVIRGEKQLAWDSKHDIAVHEAVLLASGMPTQ
ncbi:Gfo/Idh/MocA family protein [Roseimaritima ulvae]|uniref:Putative oxidoreductase YhhX n=1 Tax=Roseimaritima ulvae TaxID=980254 RepID=A0A5B9QL89_9BACT|nr:Gfo/Idh/MocA family oxidoreductase [Roseimaritima ulvae]QEG38340.1 putative oxidoreductase YhhX [Roseimaritima ulvae]